MFRAKRGYEQEIVLTCEQGSLYNGARAFAWQLYLSQIQQFEFFAEVHDKRLRYLLVKVYEMTYGIERIRMPRVAVQPHDTREHVIVADGQCFE